MTKKQAKVAPSIDLTLWECGTGGEDYARLRPLSYGQTDLFVLVLSPTDKSHWDALGREWRPELSQWNQAGAPVLFVIADCWKPSDVVQFNKDEAQGKPPSTIESLKSRWVVNDDEINQYVEDFGAIGVTTVHCKSDEGLDQLRFAIALETWKFVNRKGSSSSGRNGSGCVIC